MQEQTNGFDNSDGDKFRITPGGAFNATSSGITISAAGFVGIGTTNPATALDVSGAAQISSTLNVTGIATFANTSTSFNGLEYGFPTSDGSTNDVLTTNGSRVLTWTTPSGGGLFTNDSGFSYLTDVDEDLVLGAVTTGNANFLFDVSNAALTMNVFSGDPLINLQTASTTRWIVGVDDSDADKFRITPGGAFNATSSGITISAAGFVGIGTTNPAYELDVLGDVNGSQICINTSCRSFWPAGGGGGVMGYKHN